MTDAAPYLSGNHRRRHNRIKPLASVKRYLFDVLMERERGCCIWCRKRVSRKAPPLGQPYPPDMATLDRVVTGRQGGLYSVSNLVLACNACNLNRGDTPALVYAEQRGVELPAEVVAMLRARVAA